MPSPFDAYPEIETGYSDREPTSALPSDTDSASLDGGRLAGSVPARYERDDAALADYPKSAGQARAEEPAGWSSLPNMSSIPKPQVLVERERLAGQRLVIEGDHDDSYQVINGRIAPLTGQARVDELEAMGHNLSSPDKAIIRQSDFVDRIPEIPYLLIPNGFSDDKKDALSLEGDNEPSEEELAAFFEANPDAVGRLVYCSSIDPTIPFQAEPVPGFFFITGRAYLGIHGQHDHQFEGNLNFGKPKTFENGVSVPDIRAYYDFMQFKSRDHFPEDKYPAQVISADKSPRTFQFITNMLNNIEGANAPKGPGGEELPRQPENYTNISMFNTSVESVTRIIAEQFEEEQENHEREQEFEIPYLKIPNGIPDEKRDRYWLTADSEPTEEDLAEFFLEHPEAVERLIACSQINIDLLDDWGMFGYEPGFIFIVGKDYDGAQTLADATILRRLATSPIMPNDAGIRIPLLEHYDFFPRHKFKTQIITNAQAPKTFAFIMDCLKRPEGFGLPSAPEVPVSRSSIEAGRIAIAVPEKEKA